MTEEIIIDGVNVAGCEYFDRDSSLNNCLAHCIPYPECTCYESCDEHPNCYYKQLKRLEQENKQMKSALEEIRDMVKQANKDICDNCGWHNTDGCSPNGYLCHDLIEIKNKINEVLK